jgi:hypothetical protein
VAKVIRDRRPALPRINALRRACGGRLASKSLKGLGFPLFHSNVRYEKVKVELSTFFTYSLLLLPFCPLFG